MTCSGVMASLHVGSLLPQSCAFGFDNVWITFAGQARASIPRLSRTPHLTCDYPPPKAVERYLGNTDNAKLGGSIPLAHCKEADQPRSEPNRDRSQGALPREPDNSI